MAKAENEVLAAPSAAPAEAAPVQTAVPATPASSAAAAEPQNLSDYAELARKSLAGEATAAPEAPPAAAGNEPSPGAAAEDPAEPEAGKESETALASPEGGTEDPDSSTWTEGERKLHGALQKEREERKDARAKVRELEARLAELETKRASSEAPPGDPVAPVPRGPVAASARAPIEDCTDLTVVEAYASEASATEATAEELARILARNGVEPVAARLKAAGTATLNGKPIEEASAEEVDDFLWRTRQGTRVAQKAAQKRKEHLERVWLPTYQESLMAAVRVMPELNDAKSEAFAAATKLVRENPELARKANWPVIVAKLYLGEAQWAAKVNGKAKAAAAKPAAKPAPGAPRTSTAALPAADKGRALAAKLADGTATIGEVQEYARGGMSRG